MTTPSGRSRPKLAVWKFASCDGCQLTLLNCEDELLDLAGAVEIAYFPEATRAVVEGPYDVSLVEGSITTPDDRERIQRGPRVSRRLVTIGACATAGGIQALRNFADVAEFSSVVYAHPEYIETLAHSTPIAAHVHGRLRAARLPDRPGPAARGAAAVPAGPASRGSPSESVCMECKRRGNVCVTVAHGTPCLGPVTHAGCGALCPTYDRGCYGCFGPADHATRSRWRPAAHARHERARGDAGCSGRSTRRPPAFAAESDRHDGAEGRAVNAQADGRRPRPPVGTLARVEGEGAMRIEIRDGEVTDVQLQDLRAAAVLRGVPARPRLHRAAGHHLADLRHLPGGLPDERLPGDRGRLRRHRPGGDPADAPAALLRRVDREPHAARLPAARARLPGLRRRASRWPRTTRRSSSAGCG